MKVGDYVRTPRGITKIIDIRDTIVRNSANGNEATLGTNEIITDNGFSVSYDYKSSPRIIDLIEVGDYVNGHRVDFTNISNKLPYEDKCIGFYDGDGDIILFENDIESILTKEQFKAMEYKCE